MKKRLKKGESNGLREPNRERVNIEFVNTLESCSVMVAYTTTSRFSIDENPPSFPITGKWNLSLKGK